MTNIDKFLREFGKKTGYLMVRLIITVDPPPLWSLFCEILLRGAFDFGL